MWIPEPVVFPASSSGKATSKGGKRTAEESNEEDGLVIKKPKTPPPIDAQPWSDEDIKENSRRFTLTEQLWVHPDIWELEMDPDYKEEDRFSVDSFRYQGMLRELQSVIPDSIRGDRELGSFQLEVRLFREIPLCSSSLNALYFSGNNTPHQFGARVLQKFGPNTQKPYSART
jgi:hypothetical protein